MKHKSQIFEAVDPFQFHVTERQSFNGLVVEWSFLSSSNYIRTYPG